MPTANELYDLAVELRDQGDKPGAVSKLEEAIHLDTSFAIGHGMLAKLYADLAESDKAILHAKKVVELEPDDAFSYTALSVIYQRCGHPRSRARQGHCLSEADGLRVSQSPATFG